MAITTSPRLGAKKYGAGSDPHPSRTEYNAFIDLLDAKTAIPLQGTSDQRPPAGTRGRFYWDTTVSRMYWDDGTTWVDLNPNGGGGAGVDVLVARTPTEGTSTRAARADHTHSVPLATETSAGAMSTGDKAKLNGATFQPTGNTVMMRAPGGQSRVADPGGDTQAATPKSYVDAAGSGYSDQVTRGSGAIMRRWADGSGAYVTAPSNPQCTISKAYADTTYAARSSLRYKENIRDGVTDLIDQLRPVTFDYTTDAPAEGKDVPGFIAEELHEIAPHAVLYDFDGRPDGVAAQALVVHLVAAIQDLRAEVAELKARVQ